jgi:hypothetical protein
MQRMAMTNREKLELALKVTGVAFVVWALCMLRLVYEGIGQILDMGRAGWGETLPGWAWEPFLTLGTPLVWALLGLTLVAWARRLSEPLVGGEGALWERGAPEVLHVGFRVLGVVLLVTLAQRAVPVGFLVPRWFLVAACFPAAAVVLLLGWPSAVVSLARPWAERSGAGGAVLLLGWPSALAALGRRWAERGEAAGSDSARPLAAGIVLLCGSQVVRVLAFTASAVSFFIWPRNLPVALPEIRTWRLDGLAGDLLSLLLAVGAAVFAARVGAFLAGPARPREDEKGRSLRLAPSTWLSLSLFAGAAYVFVCYLPYLTGLALFSWHGLEALGALAHLVFVPALAALVWFWLAEGIGWRLGGRLWGRPPGADASEARGAALAAAEVCVTVIALVALTNCLDSGLIHRLLIVDGVPQRWSGVRLSHLLAAIPAAGLLLFHADVAWLFCRRRGETEADAARWREPFLRPWLALVGIWFVVAYGASPLWWAISRLAGHEAAYVPTLSALFGIGYLCALGPLTRLLSHGRLIPAIRRKFGAPGA